jgi:hypothetical protein
MVLVSTARHPKDTTTQRNSVPLWGLGSATLSAHKNEQNLVFVSFFLLIFGVRYYCIVLLALQRCGRLLRQLATLGRDVDKG